MKNVANEEKASSVAGAVSKICSIIGLIVLTYKVCFDIFINGIGFFQAIMNDPFSYATTFIPLIVSIICGLWNRMNKGFSGRRAKKKELEKPSTDRIAHIRFLHLCSP